MINIGLIPLDSRPCNTAWVKDLGLIGNANVIMYPREKCGNLHRGAVLDDMIEWLKNNASKMDYLIISSDGLSFGGLIQARLAQIDLEETLKKLEVLKELKNTYPHLKMYMFDTVMRTSITSSDAETEKYWAKMNRFSLLKGRIYFFNKEEDKKELECLEREIPSHIINTYLNARKVKFTLNKYFLNLVQDKTIDSMILLQEDSMPYGIQQIEHKEIGNFIEEHNLDNKVQFYNGTDEGAVVLLGKILLENKKMMPTCYLHYPVREVIDKCHLFEDRPFIENLNKMCKTIGFKFIDTPQDADFILSIYGIKENVDLDLSKFIEMPIDKNADYKKYINEVNGFIKDGKKVVLVDLFFPNGGSLELLEDINYQDLTVYSSWNTASNSLGSALCQIACVLANDNKEVNLNKKFLYERFFDDCIYQYFVRREIDSKLISEGVNIYNLGDKYEYALDLVKQGLKKYEYVINNQDYEVELPWSRMFEVEIILK